MRITHSAEIQAPIDLVWRVYTDVERWPQWMESMDHVDLAASGGAIEGEPLQLGSQVWISQPRLPNATWEVTELTPGRSWTWVSRSPGATSTATHHLTAVDAATTRVDTSVEMKGVFGGLAGRLIAKRAARYMAMEAEGLRAACAAHSG
ncbi:MAG TPA: SRPBCC family protein [Euzebyales bacterium]|nr:SRPBCC family protein [Euzebyales bacterium]